MNRVAVSFVACACASALLGGCASAPQAVPRLAEADRVSASPASREAAELAPEAFARAEKERAAARAAEDAGDEVAASLDADRAIAAYGHAFVLARLAKATRAEADARAQLAQAAARAGELTAQRQQIDAEGEQLEKQLTVAREAAPVVPSAGTGDAKHEAARVVAARGLLVEARLLCGSARLVGGGNDGLDAEISALDAQMDAKPSPAPIDAASRLRARCLEALTLARRAPAASGQGAAAGASDPDALLAELSASGLEPTRDERGVVITLRDAFASRQDPALSAGAQSKLADLGRVAAAHAGLGVQVVVHDASPPSKTEAQLDAQRADAVAKALVAAGAPADRVQPQTAGARNPVVDPNDAANRARNARVEVVFVTR